MKRVLYSQLMTWKNRKNRKPLLLQGARQVGKTYLLKEFGHNEYDDVAYFNFEENPDLLSLFDNSLGASSLIESLGLYRGKKIEKKSTLIFFDEIQIAPRALTSLKYFCEEAPDYHVVSAGSLLGVSVGKTSGFPVGKVNFMTLYPLSFFEYLLADANTMLVDHLNNKPDFSPIPGPIHEKLLSQLRLYLFLGGMPEVVSHYITGKDIAHARQTQKEIINAYIRDFSKYATPSESIRISEIWNSIPAQLSRENKKFKYSDVSPKSRAGKYKTALEWLNRAGLIHLSYSIKTPKLPLPGYIDQGKFKIFLHDTGILGAMLNVSSKIIIDGDSLFDEYKGAFIENYVANELISMKTDQLCYWTSKSDAEVDFILNINNNLIPLEVKSGYSRGKNSLRSYEEKYNPVSIVRLSPRNFTKESSFYNIPLYGTCLINRLLKTGGKGEESR